MKPEIKYIKQIHEANGNSNPLAGVDDFTLDKFMHEDRIHVDNWSIFNESDPLVVLNPTELLPENLTKTSQKIAAAYRSTHPYFFADKKASPVALALGGLISPNSDIQEATEEDVPTKNKEEIQKEADAKAHPFKHIVQEALHPQDFTAEEKIEGKNAIGMYLVVEEALQRNEDATQGYTKPLYQFSKMVQNPEGLVDKLSKYLNVDMNEFTHAAKTEGVDGIGKLLNVNPEFVAEVHALTDHLAENRFAANDLASWKAGRVQAGMQQASIEDKIEAGIVPRVQKKLEETSKIVQGNFHAPPAIYNDQLRVMGALKLLPPALAEVLYRSGAEISFTPEVFLKPIAPSTDYGYHRTTLPRNGEESIRQLFVSGKHNAEEFNKVMMHEAHHFLSPEMLSEQEIETVDKLAAQDMEHLKALKEVTDNWYKGKLSEEEVRAKLDTPDFTINGKQFNDILQNRTMQQFHDLVDVAHNNLQIDSEFFHRSAYNTPEKKFHEINSRYAEMRHIELADNPDLMTFIAPGLTQSYDEIYMPHVERKNAELKSKDTITYPAQAQHNVNDPTYLPIFIGAAPQGGLVISGQNASATASTSTVQQDIQHIPEHTFMPIDTMEHDQAEPEKFFSRNRTPSPSISPERKLLNKRASTLLAQDNLAP